MNAAAHTENPDDLSDEQRRGHRLRFELIFASLWLAFGLFLLPGLIFWVGAAVLGPYGENAGLGTFYIDFYGDLADASGRAWGIALGPLFMIYLLRAVFIGVKTQRIERKDVEDEARSRPPHRTPPARKEAHRSNGRPARIEPHMSDD